MAGFQEMAGSIDGLTKELIDIGVATLRRKATPEQKAILEKIYDPIATEQQPFDVDELSPTPLDPFGLSTATGPYPDVASIYMGLRLENRLDELGADIPSQFIGVIAEAITMEHVARMRQNVEALHRLQLMYIKNPDSISPELAERIYLARLGTATPLDRVEIITAAPSEVLGIEDVKYTYPLDARRMKIAQHAIISRLMTTQRDNPDFKVRILSDDERHEKRRSVNLGELGSLGNIAFKSLFAEASYKGHDILYKLRDSYTALPTTIQLGDTPARIIHKNGTPYNIQPVSISTYWTTPEQESGADASAVEAYEGASMHISKSNFGSLIDWTKSR